MYAGSGSAFGLTGRKRFYGALWDSSQPHRGGVQPQSTLSSGKACCISAGPAVWRQGTQFYRGYVEIWDKVDSPKSEGDSDDGCFCNKLAGCRKSGGCSCDLTSYLNVLSLGCKVGVVLASFSVKTNMCCKVGGVNLMFP